MAHEDDVYDLADDEPPPRRLRGAPPADLPRPPARPGPSAEPADAATTPAAPVTGQTLSYARPGTTNTRPADAVPHDARGAAADPLLYRSYRRRTLTVPIVIIAAGTLIVFACGWGISGSFVRGSIWASLSITWDVVIILLGILIGWRLVDIEPDDFRLMLLQVTAIAVATAAVFWPIMWLDRGMFCGTLVAFIITALVYCFLLSYLFELEIPDVVTLVVITAVLRLAANFVWWRFFGSFGYLPF